MRCCLIGRTHPSQKNYHRGATRFTENDPTVGPQKCRNTSPFYPTNRFANMTSKSSQHFNSIVNTMVQDVLETLLTGL